MESLIYRYRNITVLLVAVCAQMILLAWQIKGENEVPLIRAWAITAITPVASMIETIRNGATGFVGNYFALRDAREQARRLRSEVDKLKIENQLIRNELAGAQRTEALLGFQSRIPSRMLGARVIGTTTGVGTKSILIDRGSQAGVRKGMAVVTPNGIIGRILAVYPFASQVLTVADAAFAAGVESQKTHIKGVMRGLNNGQVKVDYVPGGQTLEAGELFYTSGEDRVFPKGLPAARLLSAKETSTFQEVFVQPLGNDLAPEEVLVIIDPIHQEIPQAPQPETPVFLAPDAPLPPAPAPVDATAPAPVTRVMPSGGRGPTTQADKLLDQYKKIGEAQKFVYGEGGPGSTPPNFNIKIQPATGATGSTGSTGAVKPPVKPAATVTPPKPATPTPKPAAPPATIPTPIPANQRPVTAPRP